MIEKQQDASEFNHLILERVEKGLSEDEEMSVVGANTIYDDAKKSIRLGFCSKNNEPIDNIDHSTKLQNINGHAVSLLTPRNVSEDIIEDLSTTKFSRGTQMWRRSIAFDWAWKQNTAYGNRGLEQIYHCRWDIK